MDAAAEDELSEHFDDRFLAAIPAGALTEAIAGIAADLRTVAPQDDGALVVTGLDAAAIGDLAAGRGIAVHALVPRQASLEDAYLDLTGESWRSAPSTAPG